MVSIVIVNWNGLHFLKECWPALQAQTYAPFEVIVVDNASTDGSREWLAALSPAPQLICNPVNRGFAPSNNQGIGAAHGELVALLNNDAYPDPGWLAALVAAAEANPTVGMFASLMVFADRPEVVQSAGIGLDRSGVTWDLAGGEPAAQQGQTPQAVFGPSAGAALYRRELLNTLGGFDEGFFAYLEDVDLAWRARWQGWGALLVPAARVRHVHSGTGRQGSAFKTYYLARNKIRMLLKNYPLPHVLLYAPLIALYDALSLANSLFAQRTLSGLQGRLSAWRSLLSVLRLRHAVQTSKRVTTAEVMAQLQPAAAPWQAAANYSHLDRQARP